MKHPTVSIIGGTHGMGKWLADLLVNEGCRINIVGRKTRMTAEDAARSSDVIVVSVPIAATSDVIDRVGPLLGQKQFMMDLTSLKKDPVERMLTQSVSEVVGCHPLFGPSIKHAAGHNIVLCPGRGRVWYSWIKNIFQKAGYTLLERTAEEHDRMMAVVQVLNHFNTITLGMAIAATGIPFDEILKFSTPVFRVRMDALRKVLAESPDMYADIIAGNSDSGKILQTYEDVVAGLRKLVSAEDVSLFKSAISSTAQKLYG